MDGAEREEEFDVVIIGAGIAGINAAYRLQTKSKNVNYVILDMRNAIGGTWDLFNYPGIRADTDRWTMSYPYRPWQTAPFIAGGSDLLNYIREAAKEYGVQNHIRFKHKVTTASWYSDNARWKLCVADSSAGDGEEKQKVISANFVIFCTGYYDYAEPLATFIPGIENFKGKVIHPQFWPRGYDYKNKKVVVIGSGATAVTLLPAMAKDGASHVTMLQRSPSYFLALPSVDPIASVVCRYLPQHLAHNVVRLINAGMLNILFLASMNFPNAVAKFLISGVAKQLPSHIPVDPHFSPAYKPWEQRLCVVPDGDFFTSLRDGKGSVVTDHISTFTEDSVCLKSGSSISADVVITATGLKMKVAGGIEMNIDDKKINPADKFLWKGVMIDEVPNAAFCFGYIYTSWTLGADVSAQHICRIINDMKASSADTVVARVTQDRHKMQRLPAFDLKSTYAKAGEPVLPKTSTNRPWAARASWFYDWYAAVFEGYGKTLFFSSSDDKKKEWHVGDSNKWKYLIVIAIIAYVVRVVFYSN